MSNGGGEAVPDTVEEMRDILARRKGIAVSRDEATEALRNLRKFFEILAEWDHEMNERGSARTTEA